MKIHVVEKLQKYPVDRVIRSRYDFSVELRKVKVTHYTELVIVSTEMPQAVNTVRINFLFFRGGIVWEREDFSGLLCFSRFFLDFGISCCTQSPPLFLLGPG